MTEHGHKTKMPLKCRFGVHQRTKEEHESDIRRGYAKYVCPRCGRGVRYGLNEAHDDLMLKESLERHKQER